MEYEICKGRYGTLGISVTQGTVSFSVENPEKKPCDLLLIPESAGEPVVIPMEPDRNGTDIWSVGIKNLDKKNLTYAFQMDGKRCLDPYARIITGREQWGDPKRDPQSLACGYTMERYSWGEDILPRVSKEDMVLYKLHVRGFSMSQPAGKSQGTFQGVERKLGYLQELGVTTVELMPIYEFEEIFSKDPYQKETFSPDKINYWGYTRGNYFALKSAYLGAGNSTKAFRQLVRGLHRKGMECILEFYFDKKLNPHFIIEVLRFWTREYHVDGFHLICDRQVAALVAQDPYLKGRKLFYDWFPEYLLEDGAHAMELYSYNDGFLYGIRKFLNQQGGSVREFSDMMRRQDLQQGFVNYLASNNGFTLYDSVSYNQKHNLANGEENRDGIDWNYSCNCGQEGSAKRKQTLQLRDRRIRNELCALYFAQGVPLLWMGDESGNSQEGNNNAYCQDNPLGWRSWDRSKRSKSYVAFVKQLAGLRRQLPGLRSPAPMHMNDYRRMGYPDLSYHGSDGWRMELEGSERTIGMFYCFFVDNKKKLNEEYIYVGYNFSGETQSLALPGLPKDYVWEFLLDTGAEEDQIFASRFLEPGARSFSLEWESVCVLSGRCQNKKSVTGKSTAKKSITGKTRKAEEGIYKKGVQTHVSA